MMKLIGCLVFISFLVSCAEKDPKKIALNDIAVLEDSISNNNVNTLDNLPNQNKQKDRLVDSLLNFVKENPKSEIAGDCLFKVHMIYSGTGTHLYAVKYGEQFLKEYPNNPNKFIVIESLGNAYDFYLQPRDTSKVRYYYSRLLKENKNMSSQSKKDLKQRLAHLDLTLEEYIKEMN